MSIESTLENMEKHIGKEIFLSGWTQVTQDQINKFADCTKDDQWIHVDTEKAAKGPFGTTIAHGFLTLSHLPFFSYQVPLRAEGEKLFINSAGISPLSQSRRPPARKSATGLFEIRRSQTGKRRSSSRRPYD